jgi:hypothetical protein
VASRTGRDGEVYKTETEDDECTRRHSMLPRKTSESVESHVQRITADSNGDRHFYQENGNAVFVPRFIGSRLYGPIGHIQDGPSLFEIL